MKIRYILLALVVTLSFGLAGCDFGKVEQGRCVLFDKKAGTVTFVQDVKHDAQNPEYSGQILTFKIPTDPGEMGPEPTPGGRLKIDVDKKVLVIYNYNTKKIDTVAVEFTDVKKDIGRDNPLVRGKKFPVIEKDKGTITEYSARQRLVCTFKVPAEYADLPADTWEAGNELRVYFKQPGVALRLMNISKTNIYRR